MRLSHTSRGVRVMLPIDNVPVAKWVEPVTSGRGSGRTGGVHKAWLQQGLRKIARAPDAGMAPLALTLRFTQPLTSLAYASGYD